MMTEAEWAELKVQRMASIRSSIETMRTNDQPKLRKHRFGKLHGQINELRIVGLFTSGEAMELVRLADDANREAYQAEQETGGETADSGLMSDKKGLSLDEVIEQFHRLREHAGGGVKVAVTYAPFGDGEQQLLTADQIQLLPTSRYSDYDIFGPEYVGIGPI